MLRALRRDLMLAATYQSSVSPSLYAPGTGLMAPSDPRAFSDGVRFLTEFKGGFLRASEIPDAFKVKAAPAVG